MAQIDMRTISDILPALNQRQPMTWGGKGRQGEGDSRPSARDSQVLRLRIEVRAGTKPGAHDHKVDNARLTLLTPPPSFPPVHARWRLFPCEIGRQERVCARGLVAPHVLLKMKIGNFTLG